MSQLEWWQDALHMPAGLVAGVDEVGRGPLAGPVVAAAVILDRDAPIAGLRDSKKLNATQREELAELIRARALAFAIGAADVAEIDEWNILRATHLAMRRAVLALRLTPNLVLVDGNQPPPLSVATVAIVGGDDTVDAISAASIIAKVHRDALMDRFDTTFPVYGFTRHKGYATKEHLQALQVHGPCPLHRKSFAPVRLTLDEPAAADTTGSLWAHEEPR